MKSTVSGSTKYVDCTSRVDQTGVRQRGLQVGKTVINQSTVSGEKICVVFRIPSLKVLDSEMKKLTGLL